MLILVQEISKNFKNHDENTSKIHPNAWEEGRGGKEKKKPNNRKITFRCSVWISVQCFRTSWYISHPQFYQFYTPISPFFWCRNGRHTWH